MRDRSPTPLEQITTNIDQLTRPYTHREPLDRIARQLHDTKTHTTQHPSLLNQLRLAIHPAVAELDYGGTAFGSRPPTNTDALNALIRIERETTDWLKANFGRNLRSTVEDNMRALIAASTEPHRMPAQLADLAYATSLWLTWARTESGWQQRPITIADPCPATVCKVTRGLIWGDGYCIDPDEWARIHPCPPEPCARRQAIRVRQPADSAWCIHCGAAWSENNPNLPSVILLVEALQAQRGAA